MCCYLQFLRTAGREVVPVHAQVYPQRVVQRVEQFDELLLAEVGGGEPVASRHVGAGRGVGVVSVDIGQKGGHLGRHFGAQILSRQAVEMPAKLPSATK